MLDVSVRAGILGILDELRDQGLAVLMITHDLSTAARFADRICVMYLGRIVEEGPARRCHRTAAAPVYEGAALRRPSKGSATSRRARDPEGRDAQPDRGSGRAAGSIRVAPSRSTRAARPTRSFACLPASATTGRRASACRRERLLQAARDRALEAPLDVTDPVGPVLRGDDLDDDVVRGPSGAESQVGLGRDRRLRPGIA